MRFRVLGPVAVFDGTQEVSLGGPHQRAVLALLVLQPGASWSADRFVDEIWRGGNDRAAASVYTIVSNLRRLLGRDRIVHDSRGYHLELRPDDVLDVACFERSVAAAREAEDRPTEQAAKLAEALGHWSGAPYEGMEDVSAVVPEIARLVELRATAALDRIDALLRAGQDVPVGEATALRDALPLDERTWATLARVLYRSGRQAEALRTLEDLRTMLREELGLDPSPEVVRLEERILTHDPQLDATAGGIARLPTYVSTFVGRSQEILDVADALATSRLVTLTGPGGVGKTRLAVAVAERVSHRFAGGVWLVDLAPLREPEQVGHALAATAGAAGADPIGSLVDRFRGLGVLIVVDNAEHLATEVATVADRVLARLPDVRLLVTSRRPLGSIGERVVPLRGLPIGDVDGVGDAETLFALRSRDRGVETAPDGDAVREICRRLDGIPLALELAASLRLTSSPEEIVELMDRRLGVLTDEGQTRDIHRSLEATIGWSYSLLDMADRDAFVALGVFEGSFGGDAARAVIGLADDEATLATLHRLATASLVTPQTTSARTTYRLLETLRTYARERALEQQRWPDLTRRHDEHYIATARGLADRFLGRGRVTATEAVAREMAGYVAAWDRRIGPDPHGVLPLGWVLGHVWFFEGQAAEGEARLARLVAATEGVRSVERGDVLMIASWISYIRNRLTDGRALAEEGLAIYREVGSPARVAFGLARLGHLCFGLGDGPAAMAMLHESLAVCDEAEFEDGKAWPIALIAQARRWMGDDSPEVRAALLDARRRFTETGETYGQIHADMLLSGFQEFDAEERLRFANEMVELANGPGGERLMRPIALHNLAYATWDCAEEDRARGLNRAATRWALSTGTTMNLGLCLLQAAHFAAVDERPTDAATLLGAGLAHFGMRVAPFQEQKLDEVRDTIASALGEDRADELQRIGGATSPEEAARLVLDA